MGPMKEAWQLTNRTDKSSDRLSGSEPVTNHDKLSGRLSGSVEQGGRRSCQRLPVRRSRRCRRARNTPFVRETADSLRCRRERRVVRDWLIRGRIGSTVWVVANNVHNRPIFRNTRMNRSKLYVNCRMRATGDGRRTAKRPARPLERMHLPIVKISSGVEVGPRPARGSYNGADEGSVATYR